MAYFKIVIHEMGFCPYAGSEMMKREGFILPITIVLSLILLTGVSLWYRQSITRGVLSIRLLEQRGDYGECRSLLPYVREKLIELDPLTLDVEAKDFLMVTVDQRTRWKIDRSAREQDQIRLTFRKQEDARGEIQLIIPYPES